MKVTIIIEGATPEQIAELRNSPALRDLGAKIKTVVKVKKRKKRVG